MDDHFKHFDTLCARAALRGVTLTAITNDLERRTFVLTAGAITTEAASLKDVEAWLGRLHVESEAASEA